MVAGWVSVRARVTARARPCARASGPCARAGRRMLFCLLDPFLVSIPRGTNTVIFACLEPGVAAGPPAGGYLEDCATAPCSAEAGDAGLCRRLWEVREL